MSNDQSAIEILLRSNLEQATWAVRNFCRGDEYVTIVTNALVEASISAATLALFEAMEDDGEGSLFAIVEAVRNRIRAITSEITKPEETVNDQPAPVRPDPVAVQLPPGQRAAQ